MTAPLSSVSTGFTSTTAAPAPSATNGRDAAGWTMPEVPTLAEQGLAGFEAYAWQGLVAPAAASPRHARCRATSSVRGPAGRRSWGTG